MRVVKTVKPGQRGTRELLSLYGIGLFRVRYGQDAQPRDLPIPGDRHAGDPEDLRHLGLGQAREEAQLDDPRLPGIPLRQLGEEENAAKFLELMRGIYGSVDAYEFQEAPRVRRIVPSGGPDAIAQEFVYSMVSGSCPDDCFAEVLVGEVDGQWRVLEFDIVKRQVMARDRSRGS